MVVTMPAHGVFLKRNLIRKLGIEQNDIATFLNGYTIADNWSKGDLPAGYRERGDEPVFAAAFPVSRMDEIARCRFDGALPD